MRPLIRTQSPRPGLLLLSPGDILMAAPELRTGQEQKELSNGRGRGRGPSLAYPLTPSIFLTWGLTNTCDVPGLLGWGGHMQCVRGGEN